MASLTRQRTVVWAAVSLALTWPAIAGAMGADYLVGLATRILIYGLAGISLNFVLGYGGMVSFGHAAYFGLGAYVVGVLAHHADMGEPLLSWPMMIDGTHAAVIAWPVAAVIAALAALAIGAVCLRTAGLYFIMITLAFAQMLYYFAIALPAYGGEDGLSLWSRSSLPLLDLADDRHFYYIVLALLLAALRGVQTVVGSRFGRVLRGIRDNERRMRALGFSTYGYKLTAFTISGALAGLAGALIANQTEFVSPSFLDWHLSGMLLVIVILGGIGSLFGPVAGALTYLLLEEILSQWTEHWMIVLGPILLLIVLYAQRGIWGLVDRGESSRA
jgi:branched-chain amino acid transport system permease protein